MNDFIYLLIKAQNTSENTTGWKEQKAIEVCNCDCPETKNNEKILSNYRIVIYRKIHFCTDFWKRFCMSAVLVASWRNMPSSPSLTATMKFDRRLLEPSQRSTALQSLDPEFWRIKIAYCLVRPLCPTPDLKPTCFMNRTHHIDSLRRHCLHRLWLGLDILSWTLFAFAFVFISFRSVP